MKKKGFTLVELLAVIVILALIALITTPIVLGSIESSRKGAFETSAKHLIDAANLYEANDQLIPKDGLSIKELDIKNKDFYDGLVFVNQEGEYLVKNVTNGEYCASGTKENLTVVKGDCTGTSLEPTVTSFVVTGKTTKSVSVKVEASDDTGIVGYQYCVENCNKEESWVASKENTYTYSNLKYSREYTLYVRVINRIDRVTEKSLKATTENLAVPTYAVSPSGWATSKTVKVTYPAGYQYSYTVLEGTVKENGVVVPVGQKRTVSGTSVTLTFESNGRMKAVTSDGFNEATAADLIVSQIDTTSPTGVSVGKGTVTSKSIQVTANGVDNESGITKYEFSKDNGKTWITNSTKTYTFTNLTSGTYQIKVRLTNQVGLSSEASLSIVTTSIAAPTYAVSSSGWATSKTVTVTYPTGYTNQFKVTSGTATYNGTAVTNNTWVTVTGNAQVVFTSNGAITTQVTDGVNTVAGSNLTINQIDTTAPTGVSITKGTVSSKSIEVTANGSDPESGITKYEFSKDNGKTWITNATKTYTFINLTSGTYQIKVRLTNGSGLTSEASLNIATTSITVPTYAVNPSGWATSKTVTVTYPTGYTNQFKVTSGTATYNGTTVTNNTWVTVTGNAQIVFKSNGVLIAQVTDGVNTVAASSLNINQIDTTAPTGVSITKGTVTSKSIEVTANGVDNESGITKYEFSKDNGTTWVTSSSKTYTFSGLTSGTYAIKVRLTNGSGLKSEASLSVPTLSIAVPTYAVSPSGWATSKTATINVTSGYTNQFKVTSGTATYNGTKVTNNTWITISGTSASLVFTSNGALTTQVSDGVNTVAGSNLTINQIDTTAPTGVSVGKGTVTSKSIQVTANGSDPESGITKYEFSKDNGTTWVTSSSKTYTFTNLTSGTYAIKVRLTNGSGLKTEASLSIATTTIAAPTYAVSPNGWATSKTVTVTYPTGYTNQFKVTSGTATYNGTTVTNNTWVTVTGNAQLVFTSNGALTTQISDGVNVKAGSSLTVNQIDTTAPTGVSITKGTVTSKSIEVTANGSDPESGIIKYEFSKDNGTTWVTNSTKTYTFTNLKAGSYTVRIRLTNGSGLTSEANLNISTTAITTPTYAVTPSGWATSKTVGISYPTGYTNQFKVTSGTATYNGTAITNNTWVTVSGASAQVVFTSNGAITTQVSDGVNTIAGSNLTINQIDTTAPTGVSVSIGTVTSKSIEVTANGSDPESGITKYEFSKDNGTTWVTGSSKTYTFTNLTSGSYTIKVRLTNGSGLKTEASAKGTTLSIATPTYAVSPNGWATSKTVTIKVTSGYTNQFKVTSGTATYNGTKVTNNTWITISGTSASLVFTSNGALTTQVSDGVNTVAGSSLTINQIDTTAPTSVSVGKGTVTSKSIQVTANGVDNESGITKYEFSKDNGTTWVTNSTATYTFSNLTSGTYAIKVRLTNGSGLTSEASLSIATTTLTAPTYAVTPSGWATSKTVTVTYPTGYTNQFKVTSGTATYNGTAITNNTWVTVTGNAQIVFKSNGALITQVTDGVNVKAGSSLTVNQIDTTAPTGVSITKGTVTSKSIEVTANGSDPESGITKYEFSKDNGKTWVTNTTKTYTFTNLTTGTYTIKIRLTNGAGLTTEASLSVSTANITVPTYAVTPSGWATSKTATISYPTGYTNQFKVTSGTATYNGTTVTNNTWITVSGTTAAITFTSNGALTTQVSDGVNVKAGSSLTINQIDTTAPTGVSVSIGTVTSKSIQVTANGVDNESGITKYEFSKDNGTTWITNSTKTYTFTNLTSGSYSIKVRVTNGSGLKTEASASGTTMSIVIPTYAVTPSGWATSKTATINVTSGYTNQFKVTSGTATYNGTVVTNNTWITISGTSAKVIFTSNGALTTQVSDGVNTVAGSSLTINQIDTTAPTSVSVGKGTVTSKSIQVTANGVDNDSGITKYEFSKDNGTTWVTSSSKTYTFTNLTSGTYAIKVRLTNGSGLKTEASLSIATTTIAAPTYAVSPNGWATSKTVTVTYPTGYTNQFKVTSGTATYNGTTVTNNTWVTVTGNASLVFKTNGALTTQVSDGVNVVSGSNLAVNQIDTTAPTVTSLSIASTTTAYNALTTTITSNVTDNSGATFQMYISNSGYETGGVWENYNSSKSWNVGGSLNGTGRTIYITYKDQAGNKVNRSLGYTVYSNCSSTTTTWTNSWGACSKACGTGSQSMSGTKYDTKTGASCGADSKSQACNQQSCCSSTSDYQWDAWGSCSVSCGGGVQYRTVHKKSNYDGSYCGSYQQSQVCNTHSCLMNLVVNFYPQVPFERFSNTSCTGGTDGQIAYNCMSSGSTNINIMTTSSPINLSNYRTFEITYSHSTPGTMLFAAGKTRPNSTGFNYSEQLNCTLLSEINVKPYVYSCDVSGLSGDYYLYFRAASTRSYNFNVTEWKLLP